MWVISAAHTARLARLARRGPNDVRVQQVLHSRNLFLNASTHAQSCRPIALESAAWMICTRLSQSTVNITCLFRRYALAFGRTTWSGDDWPSPPWPAATACMVIYVRM